MKKNRIIVAITVPALLLGATIYGQPKAWTLQDCIEYAIDNNISLQQSRNSFLSGLEDTYQAKAAMLPSVSVSSSQGLSNRPFSDSGTSSVVGSNVYSTSKSSSYSGNYGVNAGMTIWNGGSLRTALKQQQVQNSIDSLSVEETTNDIVISIVQAYVQCLYAKDAVSVSESNAEASKAALDRAVAMKNAGELSKVDVAQLESQHASDVYQITSSKVNLDNSLLQLKQLLELGISEEIVLEAPENEEAEILKLLPSKEEVYANALEAMPEIKKAGLNVDAAELAIKQAKTGALPSISANAGLSTTNISGTGNSIASQIQKNFNENIGLSLSVPILQGRRNKTAVNKAHIAADNVRLQQMSAEKTLLKEVENAYLDAVSSQSQYLSAKEQAKYAEQSYEYTSEAFKVGKKNTVELINAQNSLLSAQVSLLQAKYNAMLGNILLDIYQGNYKKNG
ncbi:MAG: TolC family protein [Bacteroidales bacterium]|nr:TolC family protein [Bacteroidales bacterium]